MTVWRWDQQEPFGASVPDENPSGLGAFELPIRFQGQYFDHRTTMNQFVFIAGYCLFCIAVSTVVMRFLKTWWAYFIVSATLPAMTVIGVDALWRGFLDAWADIAFVVAWLIAFACALGYYVVTWWIGKSAKGKPKESAAP